MTGPGSPPQKKSPPKNNIARVPLPLRVRPETNSNEPHHEQTCRVSVMGDRDPDDGLQATCDLHIQSCQCLANMLLANVPSGISYCLPAGLGAWTYVVAGVFKAGSDPGDPLNRAEMEAPPGSPTYRRNARYSLAIRIGVGGPWAPGCPNQNAYSQYKMSPAATSFNLAFVTPLISSTTSYQTRRTPFNPPSTLHKIGVQITF